MDKIRVKKLDKSASHCPSWQPNLVTASPKKSSFLKTRSGRHSVDPRKSRRTYSPIRRPDPTAPHLKYGLFANKQRKNSNKLRNTSQQSDYIIRPPHTNFDILREDFKREYKLNNTKSTKNGQLAKSSVFIYPSTTRKLDHHLSVSEVKHLDIKPKMNCNPRTLIHAKNFQVVPDIPTY